MANNMEKLVRVHFPMYNLIISLPRNKETMTFTIFQSKTQSADKPASSLYASPSPSIPPRARQAGLPKLSLRNQTHVEM